MKIILLYNNRLSTLKVEMPLILFFFVAGGLSRQLDISIQESDDMAEPSNIHQNMKMVPEVRAKTS